MYVCISILGKRVGAAAIKIANDIVDQKLATIDEAIMTVKPEHLNQLLHPQFPTDFIDSSRYDYLLTTKDIKNFITIFECHQLQRKLDVNRITCISWCCSRKNRFYSS